MLHLISPSGILFSKQYATWTDQVQHQQALLGHCVGLVFSLFFVFLVYCTALLLVFLAWTNKRIIVPLIRGAASVLKTPRGEKVVYVG